MSLFCSEFDFATCLVALVATVVSVTTYVWVHFVCRYRLCSGDDYFDSETVVLLSKISSVSFELIVVPSFCCPCDSMNLVTS